VTIAGVPETIWQPDKLHYIGRVSGHDIAPLSRHSCDIPLLFGLRFSGCDICYEVESESAVQLMDLMPARPTEDYPYENYPSILPYVPLRLGRKERLTYSKFSQEFPNMNERQPADVVIAVPEPTTLGISLWGSHGGLVTVVFEYDFHHGTVSAYPLTD
jgi:hypothetical protein